ncbi:IclR family transcriptional regulator [Psychromicrobium sp. YIM B11713]|uniref:IclR family transcriptional regulator n=1 Tax=Psychromicrobium sp. YIM B11713 TaxID=3145233 RepID=UPI00374EF4DE
MAEAHAAPSTKTVERALNLLGVVCDRGSVSLAEAARDAELSASTALRLLRTMETAGFVRKEDDGYRPGMRIVQLGAQALANESLVSMAQESMRRLVAATGESAYLNVRSSAAGDSQNGIYIAVQEGTHSVRHSSWVGRSIPLEGTAAGAALTGLGSEGGLGSKGYIVVTDGVEADVTAIASPVVVGGRTVAALSVVAPSYRISAVDAERIGALLAAEASSILNPDLQSATSSKDRSDPTDQSERPRDVSRR